MKSDEELLKYVNEMSGENYVSLGDVPHRTLLLIHIFLLWQVIDSYPVWPTLTSAESIECKEHKDVTVSDGFGTTWSAYCPECGEKTMQVVRPGRAECSECDG